MAPMNFADQPMSLVRALRRRGVHARQLQYTATGLHPLSYELDKAVKIRSSDVHAQLAVLAECIEEQYDVYHFWQRSLLFDRRLKGITGLDIPILKSRGASVFHRFTGFDLRMPTLDREYNRFSPYHQGYESPFDETRQQEYLEFLKAHVDIFFVQDPELAQFIPDAKILPRGLQLGDWEAVGIQPTTKPLVVHAPSKPEVKGSTFIVTALEELKHEGLQFEFQLLERVPHATAREWYRRADIIIDQILIGATGVLTLEAWALGKPCVTYLRTDLFEPFYETSDLPVANANPETIKSVLRKLIRDYEWRTDLSSRGRALVERYHDIDKIAGDYHQICREQRLGKELRRIAADDVHFLRDGYRDLETPELPLTYDLGLATDYPHLAAIADRALSMQESVFKWLLRFQIRATRPLAVAFVSLSRQVTSLRRRLFTR